MKMILYVLESSGNIEKISPAREGNEEVFKNQIKNLKINPLNFKTMNKKLCV
jgi:hypothetical protein